MGDLSPQALTSFRVRQVQGSLIVRGRHRHVKRRDEDQRVRYTRCRGRSGHEGVIGKRMDVNEPQCSEDGQVPTRAQNGNATRRWQRAPRTRLDASRVPFTVGTAPGSFDSAIPPETI